jgi:hypothetical protein
VLSLHMGFAVWVYIDVQGHRVAADGAILDVVLVSAGRDIHGNDDLLAARVADIRGLKVGNWLSTAACFLRFLHDW